MKVLCSEGNIIATGQSSSTSFGELVQSFLLYAELTPQLQGLRCQINPGAENIRVGLQADEDARNIVAGPLESKLRGLKKTIICSAGGSLAAVRTGSCKYQSQA